MSTTTERSFEELTQDWDSYYGIKLADAGEDGDVVVLGHHADPKRVIAALNRHARKFWGEPSLASSFGGSLADVAGGLTQRWARFLTTCEGEDHDARVVGDGSCWRCAEIAEGQWWITWSAKSDEAGAFPITHWGS